MKTWRVLGLVCASLFLPYAGGCGGGGGGGAEDEKDSSSEPVETDDLDGGIDGGDEPPDDPDTGMSMPPPQEDAGVDSGDCVPKSCRQLGATCGMPDDGCGRKVPCGECEAPQTCGGGGVDFKCGCTAKTCESESKARGGAQMCGKLADGCGGEIDCGDPCTAPNKCHAGPADNQCGCQPNLTACAGKECGTASDGCGGTVQCGSSAGMCSANKECSAQQTCTCKTDLSAFCAGKCGTQTTPDGCAANCGSCTQTCAGEGAPCGSCQCPAGPEAGTQDDGVCRDNACCMPQSVAALCAGAQCGTRVNRCGLQVTCGTCGAGQACDANGQCQDPAAAALIGRYAARAVGFAKATVVARAESLLLVDIYRDTSGKLMMREQPCWSAGYTSGTPEKLVTESVYNPATPAPPTEIEIDLTQARNLPGPKEWVRAVQPPEQNTFGWRRGRPSYCPANGGPPDPNLPGYGPAGGGPRAVGALKPWLSGPCLCPSQEVDKRLEGTTWLTNKTGWCPDLTGAAKTACVEQWAQNHLPYQRGSVASPDSDVTDCRVVDDDGDGLPAGTQAISVDLNLGSIGRGSATVRSASVIANVIWGKIDMSPAKAHWGVGQDQIGLVSANVACLNPTGTWGTTLCGTSTGDFCPAFRAGTPEKNTRINTIDFVSLHDKTAPAGGWTCEAVLANRNNAAWFSQVAWATRYPDAAVCNIPGM